MVCKVRTGCFDLEDQQRSGRPQELNNDELVALLEEDPLQPTLELAKKAFS